MLALHTIAKMLPKAHFIHCAKPAYTKIAYKKYIFKITYSKLASFNSNPKNEGVTKLRTFLKQRPHNHLSENQKKNPDRSCRPLPSVSNKI